MYSSTPATSHYRIPGYFNPKPLVIPDYTNPKLLAIPDYCKLWRMPPGSPWMLLHTMKFRKRSWHVQVKALGFIKGVPTSVTVRVSTIFDYYREKNPSASGINISVEILDCSFQRTVFHQEETLG